MTCQVPGCGHTLPCPWHRSRKRAPARDDDDTVPVPVDVNQCADGATYDHEQDHGRLALQRGRVLAAMQDEGWHTLASLAAVTGDPEASVSARMRDFRKERFGGHVVERRRIAEGRGEFEYRLILARMRV